MKRLRLAPWVTLPSSKLLGVDNLTNMELQWPVLNGSEYYDPLTGVYNRRAYDNLIELGLREAAKQNAGIGLIVLDIDYFKRVNDTYGHVAGDAVLVEFTQRIISSLREGDFLARLGGEEFVVLTLGYTKIFEIGERVRLAVGQAPFIYKGLSIPITCSFGCAVYPLDGYTQEDIFQSADKALYYAKANGRNVGFEYCKIKEFESEGGSA